MASLAKANFIKLTGDGFLIIWEMSDDVNNNLIIAQLVYDLSIEMASFVRISKFNLNIDEKLFLREGITIEPYCIQVKMKLNGILTFDYLGDMINYAFRFQSLAIHYPYVCIHKNYYDLIKDYLFIDNFKPVNLDENTLKSVFKNIIPDQSKILIAPASSEDRIDYLINKFKELNNKEFIESDLYKTKVMENKFMVENAPLKIPESKIIDFHNKIHKFYRNGPKWLKNSKFLVWGYHKALAIEVYDLENRKQ
jgi:hypothetical protein